MGINRNIVECKYVTERFYDYLKTVLIETLWNVNMHQHPHQHRCRVPRINRNIVECK